MTDSVELIAVEGGLGVVFTPEMIRQINGHPGDRLAVTLTPTGIEMVKPKGDLAAHMAVAERVMREDHALLRKLAE